MTKPLKIFVIGKGGREHALIAALARSPTPPALFSYPGSAAIAELATVAELEGTLDSLLNFMLKEKIDLCLAGEESFLVKEDGLANRCRAEGIRCWGPPREAAQLEADKVFSKQFMVRHGIPTATFAVANSLPEAREAIGGYPVVLKFAGLAAGKGVAVCADEAEAEAFLREVFTAQSFGPGPLLIEECLSGPEISVFVSVADGDYQILAAARDYKRIFDGDQGPNTGGMGAVASPSLLPETLRQQVETGIVRPTVAGLQADGLPYRGFLYFGLMLTANGPMLLEYNCRFGDPEAEAVMPLLRGDFAQYLYQSAGGALARNLITMEEGWSICVILASAAYPAQSQSGSEISGLEAVDGALVYHCGTRRHPQGWYETNGGRILAVVAQAQNRQEAVEKVYAEAEKISFDGRQRRTDIGRLHF